MARRFTMHGLRPGLTVKQVAALLGAPRLHEKVLDGGSLARYRLHPEEEEVVLFFTDDNRLREIYSGNTLERNGRPLLRRGDDAEVVIEVLGEPVDRVRSEQGEVLMYELDPIRLTVVTTEGRVTNLQAIVNDV